jgi:hypothetical protein
MMSCLRAEKRAYPRMGCAHRAHKSYTTVRALAQMRGRATGDNGVGDIRRSYGRIEGIIL